jgi:hypothetical protein
MTEAAYRKIALSFNDTEEQSHMGHPDFRVGGRIFATLHGNKTTGALMLTPERQKQFLKDESGAFAPAAGAWGLKGATVVTLKLADAETVGEAMTFAWQIAVALGPTKTASGSKPARRASGPARGRAKAKSSPARRPR